MQDKLASPRIALDQRAAQLEQLMRRGGLLLRKVPLERWKWLAIALLVLWLSYSLARLFWLLVPNPVIPAAPASAIVITSGGGGTEGQTVDVTELQASHLFGEAEATDEPEDQAPAPTNVIENEAVDTQLNLVLRGVIGSNEEKGARAIIANGADQDVYSPGDNMPVGQGVTLAKVLDARVILNNNGRYESLWLYKEDPNARAAMAAPYVPDETTSRSRPDEAESGAADGQPQALFKGDEASDAQGPVEQPQTSAEVANTLSDVVAMSIYREGGKVVGYKIRPGRNADQFTALGLQTGDIVTAVNGTPLTSAGKVMEIYRNMSSATSANLEIKRGGSVISIDVVLQ